MEVTQQTPQPNDSSLPSRTLQVDFTWKKFNALITDKDNPQAKPLYVVDYKTLKQRLDFKYAADESVFGTGTYHVININADCEIHGKPIVLQALRHLHTSYMHLSNAFSDTGKPVPLTWTSDGGFKTWDFICLDAKQRPVAKFTANMWATKKVGRIEFIGDKATSRAGMEELLVMGMTLFSCMLWRASNFLSLFGAAMVRPEQAMETMRKAELEANSQ